MISPKALRKTSLGNRSARRIAKSRDCAYTDLVRAAIDAQALRENPVANLRDARGSEFQDTSADINGPSGQEN
jgi:hypothetical protein